MKKSVIISGVIALSAAMGACTNDSEPAGNGIIGKLEIPSIKTMELDKTEASLNEKLNDFAFKFLNQSVADTESCNVNNGNIVVSPHSASLAMALVANSCNDESTQTISDMLDLDDIENLNFTVNKLMRFLSFTGEGETLDFANSVWYDETLLPNNTWKNKMLTELFSVSSPIDFSSDMAIKTINNWCSINTHGMIKSFLEYIEPHTQVFFLNALYYAGKWKNPFNKKNTDIAKFKGRDGESEVGMMHTSASYYYYKSEYCELLSIPFRGNNELVMILPDECVSASDVAKQLNLKDWNKFLSNSKYVRADLSMPKFKCDTEDDITDTLCKLGLPSEISLTKMGSDQVMNVYAKQKNATQFDEEGATVSSVTGIGISTSTGDYTTEKVALTFDRPFIFVIHNTITGTILMTGVINNL